MKKPLGHVFAVISWALASIVEGAVDDPDLIAYEPFNYPIGTSVEFLDGGFGWAGPWLWRTNFDGKGMVLMDSTKVLSGSLLYGDLDTTGNHLLLSGEAGTLELGRGFSEVIEGRAGSQTYISFLALRTGEPMNTAVSGYRWGTNPYPRGASLRFWDESGGERLSIGNRPFIHERIRSEDL